MPQNTAQCVSSLSYLISCKTHNLIIQGTESELAGKSDACAGCDNQAICASGATKLPDPSLPFIKQRMSGVKRKILILSGKGGVGKSTFTAQLGWAFAADEETQVRRWMWFYFFPFIVTEHS